MEAALSLPRKNLDRFFLIFFFNDTATTEIYTLSLHDALPISPPGRDAPGRGGGGHGGHCPAGRRLRRVGRAGRGPGRDPGRTPAAAGSARGRVPGRSVRPAPGARLGLLRTRGRPPGPARRDDLAAL